MANRIVQIRVSRYGYVSVDENLTDEEIVRELESGDYAATIDPYLQDDYDIEVLN